MAVRGFATDVPAIDPEAELIRATAASVARLTSMLNGLRGARADFVRGQLGALRDTVARLGGAQAAWVGQAVPNQFSLSAGAANLTLDREGFLVEAAFGGFDRRALRALLERTSTNLANIRQALFDGLVLGDPRQATTAIQEALEGDNRSVEVDGGGVAVRTPSGRLWDVTAYSRMLGRTAIADARRVAFRTRYLANGVDVVKVVANGTRHDVCKRWEGKLLSLTGATPGIPTVEEARRDGLFHPNCRHRYVVAPGEKQPGQAALADAIQASLPEEAPRSILGEKAATALSRAAERALPEPREVKPRAGAAAAVKGARRPKPRFVPPR
ncbi:MAG: phage minor capsid protein [Myxococcaceae bacterium]|nr:phage minor capsid protein [Myxococcaceae bacterium]